MKLPDDRPTSQIAGWKNMKLGLDPPPQCADGMKIDGKTHERFSTQRHLRQLSGRCALLATTNFVGRPTMSQGLASMDLAGQWPLPLDADPGPETCVLSQTAESMEKFCKSKSL